MERRSEYAIDPRLLSRWSSRAFAPEPIATEALLALFEAARWAPSAFNSQPWRFVYRHREDPAWAEFVAPLHAFNQTWAPEASALVYLLSRTRLKPRAGAEETEAASHAFDAGAAWAFLALQAESDGLVAHAMSAFDAPAVLAVVGASGPYSVQAAIAIGRRGDPARLPPKLRERETPSDRKPLGEIAFEGRLPPGEP